MQLLDLLGQLADALHPRPGGRLVRGGHHGPQVERPVERSERHQGRDRGAVRVGHDAVMAGQGVGVDLWDDQRDVRVHPEPRGVVDAHRPGGGGRRQDLAGHRAARRCQRQIDPFEPSFAEGPDRDLFAPEREALALGSPRREQHQLVQGEIPLLDDPEHLATHGSGCPDDGHPHRTHPTGRSPLPDRSNRTPPECRRCASRARSHPGRSRTGRGSPSRPVRPLRPGSRRRCGSRKWRSSRC